MIRSLLKIHHHGIRSKNTLLLLIPLTLFVACKNDMEQVKFFDHKNRPAQTMINAKATRSSFGQKQLLLTAPRIEQYNEPDAHTLYPKGLEITFFDEQGGTTAWITARHGASYDARNIMEARDSVVIIDYRTGDTSYLDILTWDANEHRIYSDHPIRSVNGNRVTYGDGFESDENFNNPQILHQRGTIEFSE